MKISLSTPNYYSEFQGLFGRIFEDFEMGVFDGEMCDLLVFSGGADISPHLYHDE